MHYSARPRVLILADYFLPGFKAGGPIQTLANIVEQLGDQFDFRIVARDRDARDPKPYPGIRRNAWQRVGKAFVLYLPTPFLNPIVLRQVITDSQSDVVYLNSFFSPVFTVQALLLRKLRLLPRIPFVIAPRGEFSPRALELKKLKKRAYLFSARTLRLYSDLQWQASASLEEEQIRTWFGSDVPVHVAPDLIDPFASSAADRRPAKASGKLTLVFASRISPKKNLLFALALLSRVVGNVEFHICGPVDDENYWRECKGRIAATPANVSLIYHGPIPHGEVHGILSRSHIFFLPTLGENFGHAIVEALRAGCPVLISDQTPWRNLQEKHVGWDLPLTSAILFKNALQACIDMDAAAYQLWSSSARAYGNDISEKNRGTDLTRRMFERVITSAAEP